MTTQNKTYFNYLFGIIPAFILIIPTAGEIAFVLISIYSLIYCYQKKINPFTNFQTKAISFICIFYFSIALLSILASDISLYAFKRLGTNFHFLIAPWVAVLLSQKLNAQALSTAIKIGAILAGIIALTQYFYLGQRAHGTVNAIPFSDIALLLSFFSIINIHHETKTQKYISFFSFILGCSAVVFSLSRGAWITFPFLFILLLFIWYKQKYIALKPLILLAITGILLMAAAGLSPQIQSRFNAMQQNIQSYEKNSLTSVGVRITLWKTAIKAIPSHPILGFGLHNTRQVAANFIEDKNLKNTLHQFGHFHNEYLTTLVGKGGLGLISLFILLIAPCIILYKNLFQPKNHYLPNLVLLLSVGYAFFGLTNLAFGHGIMNTFFVFILASSTAAIPSNNSSMHL